MEYKKFSDKQLSRAKNADIIEFLKAYCGFDFKKRYVILNAYSMTV